MFRVVVVVVAAAAAAAAAAAVAVAVDVVVIFFQSALPLIPHTNAHTRTHSFIHSLTEGGCRRLSADSVDSLERRLARWSVVRGRSRTRVPTASAATMADIDAEELKAAVEAGTCSEYDIDLRSKGIARISQLDAYPKLRALNLGFNQIERIQGLEGLPDLRQVQLYNNELTSTEGLGACEKLEVLFLHNNRIEEISADFRKLKALQTLRLDNNRIARVPPLLGRCMQLASLDLSQNCVSDISRFPVLLRLQYLDLSCNSITDVRPLAPCVSLLELRLSSNSIENVKSLRNLKRLQTLSAFYLTVLQLVVYSLLRNMAFEHGSAHFTFIFVCRPQRQQNQRVARVSISPCSRNPLFARKRSFFHAGLHCSRFNESEQGKVFAHPVCVEQSVCPKEQETARERSGSGSSNCHTARSTGTVPKARCT